MVQSGWRMRPPLSCDYAYLIVGTMAFLQVTPTQCDPSPIRQSPQAEKDLSEFPEVLLIAVLVDLEPIRLMPTCFPPISQSIRWPTNRAGL
ncbi:uncharacterized protein BCR38DRAFT_436857 [Pseudomassariella vexata]|uniref:Uncharacterized protein n=1 Tax=Pseudomassariella vexata TaxID=1141098 RepID=A0A1Y2DW01_9PEZI|nr:uncharacterized protein BCR38DRAFT_436857 [Pseudomassariella vexata]ORY63443.1 hypothetical protein BCR38DRAFT_436857 [Pseudomassariella vexata]